jgi:hypothetical protein
VTGLRGVRDPGVVGVLVVGGVVVATIVLVPVVVLVLSGSAGAGGALPRSIVSPRQALAFDGPRLFSVGRSVGGLPLTAVLQRDDTARYVSFVYGDCEATGDSGCAPPAEVQVWPVCRRSLALYDGEVGKSPVPEPVRVRGVPGAFFDRGTRLELETGRSLVVVFARTRAQALLIAAELEAVDGSVAAGSPLPPPVADGGTGGAMGC